MGAGKAKKPIGKARVSGAKGPRRPRPRLFDWSQYDPSMSLRNGAAPRADELVAYRDHLGELLKDEGKYVLIKGSAVVGVYDCRAEALRQAVARFRDAPVLVKQIVAKEPVRELGGVVF